MDYPIVIDIDLFKQKWGLFQALWRGVTNPQGGKCQRNFRNDADAQYLQINNGRQLLQFGGRYDLPLLIAAAYGCGLRLRLTAAAYGWDLRLGLTAATYGPKFTEGVGQGRLSWPEKAIRAAPDLGKVRWRSKSAASCTSCTSRFGVPIDGHWRARLDSESVRYHAPWK
ncbi:hypothetical protein [Cupriavidus sp. a3]|uniref:hypothetical protein n=1 Tax=Cupriavidus sp. a3 TaxID=3242158 RepID=UPI003D9C203F